mgnify:CR=1 FL=1
MKEQMKKIALLSLSLILTSAYSVSIVLPSLLQHFSEYTTAQVEMLISAPSFAITVMIVLNAWLSRYMKDRPMIVGGLLLLSVSGMVPVFVQEYPVMFASRIFLGIGIGLINAKAISIFSEYYEGREKAALLGYRGSAEVLTMFGSLPEEVAVLRKSSDRVIRLQQSISVPVKTSKMLSKTERDKIAVDMYNNGYSVNEIMAHCNVKSKSTVYQILGKYNVALSRKPGRVPGNRK